MIVGLEEKSVETEPETSPDKVIVLLLSKRAAVVAEVALVALVAVVALVALVALVAKVAVAALPEMLMLYVDPLL